MDIVRNPDGTLVVPVAPERHHDIDDAEPEIEPESRVLHPGEGGYDEALAAWDVQQNPARAPALSTRSGREEAMALVHTLAHAPKATQAVSPAVEALDDPVASGEALRHVLIGGVPSVEAFAHEIADAEGGDPLSAHQTTKIIGEVLAVLDR
ncbi:MAG: hypothetical protein ACRDV9_06855, partial [Acidimicrobiia bacterium]